MKNQFKHLKLLTLALTKSPQHQNQGYVLIVVLGIGVAMLGLLTAYGLAARTERLGVTASKDSGSGFSAAEAGLNLRAEAIRKEFEYFSRPTGTSPTEAFCSTSDTTTTNDFRCINFSFPDTSGAPGRVVSTYMQDITTLDPACAGQANCEPRQSRVPQGQNFQGLSMQEYAYKVYAITRRALQLDPQGRITQNSPIEGMMEMEIKSRLIPMFQFAAFYNNDLEISPGPQMQFDGPIHTNRNLMLAGWFGADGALRINGQITVARPGRIYNAVVPDNCGNNCTSLSRTNDNRRVQIRNATNTSWINLLEAGTGSGTPTSNPMVRLEDPRTNIALANQVQTGISSVTLPAFSSSNSFLRCDSTDPQNVCGRADINITYNPADMADTASPTNAALAIVPFGVSARNQADNQTVTSTRTLSIGELRSMRQPVLVTSENTGGTRIPGARGSVSTTRTSDNLSGVCAPDTSSSNYTSLNNWLNNSSNATENTLITTNRTRIQNALRVALVSQLRPVEFNQLSTELEAAGVAVPTTTPDRLSGDILDLVAFDFRQSLINQLGGNAAATSTADNIIRALRQKKATDSNPNERALPSLQAIASIAGGSCFVSAPLQEITRHRNDREGRNIRMLQMNVASLAIWNRDGRYVVFNGVGNSLDTLPTDAAAASNSGVGWTAANTTNAFTNNSISAFLYRVLAPETAAPADSFQRFGYAAADRSHGGMVVHFGMATGIDGIPSPGSVSFPDYRAGQSPYGFMIMGARQLFGRASYSGYNQNPAGVTFASNQPVYVQGDFNNFLTNPNDPTFDVSATGFLPHAPNTLVWQPSSILADSINVYSNQCRNTLFDRVIKTGSGQNCNAQNDPTPLNDDTGTRAVATDTTTRVAFLSGTDVTGSSTVPGFSGGLQNYPRYAENWGNDDPHVYTGSFVSLGSPNEVTGRWDAQSYSPPRRIWAYETRFNNASNLPPLTPRFVSLQQEIFRRRFSR